MHIVQSAHARHLILVVGLLAAGLITSSSYSAALPPGGEQQQAAADPCAAEVNGLLEAIDACRALNTNYACYGAYNINAASIADTPHRFRFFHPKDREHLELFQTISSSAPLGAVVMKVYAGASPDPVTVLQLPGAGLLEEGKAFFVRAQPGKPVCETMPPGLIVRTQSGQKGVVKINNVDVLLGSSALVTPVGNDGLVVATLDGVVGVFFEGLEEIVMVPAGQQVEIVLSGSHPISVGAPHISPYAAPSAIATVGRALGGVVSPETDTLSRMPRCLEGDWPVDEFGEILVDLGERGTVVQGHLTGSTASRGDPGQECVFKVCLRAGDALTVSMIADEKSSINPYLDFRAPDQSRLMWNDDISATNKDSLICNQIASETGCYHVVARSRENTGAGGFSVIFEGSQVTETCERPQPRCDVTPRLGTDLREGPGETYASVRTVPQGDALTPLQEVTDQEWIQVRVVDGGETGWIKQQDAYCDQVVIREPVTPARRREEEPDDPTPIPTKLAPWSGP